MCKNPQLSQVLYQYTTFFLSKQAFLFLFLQYKPEHLQTCIRWNGCFRTYFTWKMSCTCIGLKRPCQGFYQSTLHTFIFYKNLLKIFFTRERKKYMEYNSTKECTGWDEYFERVFSFCNNLYKTPWLNCTFEKKTKKKRITFKNSDKQRNPKVSNPDLSLTYQTLHWKKLLKA